MSLSAVFSQFHFIFIVFLVLIKFKVFGAKTFTFGLEPFYVDHRKNVWLTQDFFIIRNIIALLVMVGLVQWSKKQTLADKAFLAGKLTEAEELKNLVEIALDYLVVQFVCTRYNFHCCDRYNHVALATLVLYTMGWMVFCCSYAIASC